MIPELAGFQTSPMISAASLLYPDTVGRTQTLAAVLDAVTDGIIVVDRAWCIVWANEVTARRLGTHGQALIGTCLWSLNPHIESSLFGQAYKRAMEENTPVVVEAAFPPNDAIFEGRAYPAAEGLLITFRDVSARRRLAEERERLLHAEAEARRLAERSAGRLEILQSLTSRLAGAVRLEQVLDIVVGAALSAVGGAAASVALGEGDELHMVAHRGFKDELAGMERRFSKSLDMPVPEAYRTGKSLWFCSADEISSRYPSVERAMASAGVEGAMACLPLCVNDLVLGAVAITFPTGREFPSEDRQVLEAIAHQCALAVDRAQTFQREHDILEQTRATALRSRFLAEASEILASSLNYHATLDTIAGLAVPTLADWCAVDMLEADGSLRRLAVKHQDPAKIRFVEEIATRYPSDRTSKTGVYNVIRTGAWEWMPEIPESLLQAVARSEEHLQLIKELGLRSYICVPIKRRGTLVGALTAVHAESGRTYSEADLQLLEELARRAGVAVDNSLLYEEAQEAIRLREEFLSVASHELKTPLTPLQLRVQGLGRDLERGDSERVRQHTDVIQRQVRKLSTLIDGLLDVSRITAGRLQLDLEEVEICAVIREVVSRHEQEAVRAGSPIQVDVCEPLLGHWDRLRLEQVVTNLIANAIKYGAGKPIHVLLTGDESRVHLEVRDEGIGISSEDARRIFERFERAVPSRNYGGLGLGLYISRSIVEAMGGQIRVKSEPGEGSVFVVELPRSAPRA